MLVKSPETVKEEVSSIVKVLPVATVTEPAAASVLDIEGSLVNVPLIITKSLDVGAAPVLQFVAVDQSVLVAPFQLHGVKQLIVAAHPSAVTEESEVNLIVNPASVEDVKDWGVCISPLRSVAEVSAPS